MQQAALLSASVVICLAGVPKPGTSSECWQDGFTYELCCLRSQDIKCFDGAFDETRCCSGMLEGLLSWTERGTALSAASSWSAVQTCADNAKAEASLASAEMLTGNSFLETLTCVAALPTVDIVMDTFLGGGFSCRAVSRGLSAQKARKRPPTVISFEKYRDEIDKALTTLSQLPLLLQRPPKIADIYADEQEGIPLSEPYKEKLYRYQELVLKGLQEIPGNAEEPPQILIAHGTPLVHKSLSGYAWNALDIACQHLAPLDLVVIDQDSHDSTKEWLIIETVCRPRLVALFNVNIFGSGSWIKNRLELQDNWQLEAQGVVELGKTPWLSMAEVRRLRAWTIFSNLME